MNRVSLLIVLVATSKCAPKSHSTDAATPTDATTLTSPATGHTTHARRPLPVVEGLGYRGVIFPASSVDDDWWSPAPADVADLEGRLLESLSAALRKPGLLTNLDKKPLHFTRNQWNEMRRVIERMFKDNLTKIISKLKWYRRQYFGRVIGGKRYINAKFFPSTRDGVSDRYPYWREAAVLVHGGGISHWAISFDVDEKTFHRMWVNAPR